jgi:tetratricopeptide (TPR) repeat protein
MEKIPSYEPEPVKPSPKKLKKEKKGRGRWILLGILLILIFGGLGVWLGVNKGVSIRLVEFEKLKIQKATMQFELGEIDLAEGRLDVARKRFENVLELDGNFPGLREKLTELEVAKAMLATPTISVTSTATLAPTPDTQNQEQRFAQAQDYLKTGNWQAALDTLDVLRSTDLQYQSVAVDGMYYMAYRNRGVNKIISEGNLEGGIYDLALAAQYGPIDKEAGSYSQAAKYFQTGSAFWEVDWKQAAYYFSQVYASLPNLRDGSNFSATERYRLAAIGYGDDLMEEGKVCEAVDQYVIASGLGGNENFQATLAAAQLKCSPPTSTPQATSAVTETPGTVVNTEVVSATEAPTAEVTVETPAADAGSGE